MKCPVTEQPCIDAEACLQGMPCDVVIRVAAEAVMDRVLPGGLPLMRERAWFDIDPA